MDGKRIWNRRYRWGRYKRSWYGDLYLTKMPKEGAKGLVTIKRAFNLEMSTGELLQKSKSLPTKLLSNITSSKANIIAEKIGMSGLFE